MTTFVVDFFLKKKRNNDVVFLVFNLLAPGSTSVAELEKSGRKAAATGSKGKKTKVTGDAESGVCFLLEGKCQRKQLIESNII